MSTVLIPVFGGLGNQMFQVAHALALGKNIGAEPLFIDLTSVNGRVSRKWELGCFNIRPKNLTRYQVYSIKSRIAAARRLQKINPGLHLEVLDESYARTPDDLPFQPKVCSGYWQGAAYFDSVAKLVRRTFTFPDVPAALARSITPPNRSVVGVHVRRGDYVTDPVAHSYHFVCDENWYLKALQTMRDRLPDCHFCIFSDDPAWAEIAFGSAEDVSIVPTGRNAPAWLDMALMSQCSHFIISNSSYSWWASYLGKSDDSLIIAPAFWFPGVETRSLEIFCSDWVLCS